MFLLFPTYEGNVPKTEFRTVLDVNWYLNAVFALIKRNRRGNKHIVSIVCTEMKTSTEPIGPRASVNQSITYGKEPGAILEVSFA
ncbi:hypothetical protein GWI33_016617 [Rhynchophorus ferrugineus]|uniref:Uncharacterized protein n=1 Tax=Rhynchophorus ferrugineus TaxID=354439 RepID=A0A834HX19_RHYFE|nr:hypothetical protein GWI33_016617 [Rhynchophorus ferrugineus]